MSALRLLALDTSTLTASAAVVRVTPGESLEVMAEGDAETGSHSERLMPLVAEVMAHAGLALADLDAIACGAGPGSFTGLRIGLATAKGLAFAAEKPLWLVSSLGALAWSMEAGDDAAPVAALRVPILDARRGELYAGFYRHDGAVPRAVAPERVMPPGELAAAIAAVRFGDETVTLGGDALVAHAASLAALDVEFMRLESRATPSAVGVAALAASGDRADGLAHGAPAYLRLAEAEVLYPEGVPGAVRKR